MTTILRFAVVILAALWFFPGTYTLGNKRRSNLEEFDFYFDEKSLNESTHQGNSSKSKTTEFNQNGDHKIIDKPRSESTSEKFAVWNLKRLLRYFISLLYSSDEKHGHDDELLHEYKYERMPYSKHNKFKMNPTNATPRLHKSDNTEKVSGADFENSGSGNDSEYYDEDIVTENPHEKGSGIKNLKPNIGVKPRFRNYGEISEDPQGHRSDNHKLTSDLFQLERESAKHSSLRIGQVSEEFIDDYINPPEEEVLMKSNGSLTATLSIIPNEKENQTLQENAPLKKSTREGNVSKIEDRQLNNSQNPVSGNIANETNVTLNKTPRKDEFPRNRNENSGSTPHITFSNQTEEGKKGLKKENSKEISVVGNVTQNSFSPNNSILFLSDITQDNKNHTLKIIHFSTGHTSKIFTENYNSPEEIEVSHSKNSEISGFRNDMYDKNQEHFSVLGDFRENHFLKENSSRNSEPEMQSKETFDSPKNMFSQYPLNSTKGGNPLQNEYNSSNKLIPQNGSIDTESENDTDVPTRQHSPTLNKYPKLEEKRNRESFNASDKLNIQTDSDTDSDSSENSDSEELYEYDEYDEDDEDVQEMPNFANYFTETNSNDTFQIAQNLSAPYANHSMKMEFPINSKNETKINTFRKTQEMFDSILEFLYKYSNSTLIKKMKEEKRRL